MQHDASNTLTFYYGVDGVIGFHLKNSLVDADYYYKKNAQNDIIGIYSTDGTEIAQYEYDAWGNCIAKYLQNGGTYDIIKSDYKYNDISNLNRFIAYKNPFRYRSYYYDFETNLYYLNSRYYDPEIGRFINADDITTLDVTKITLNGLNLYAYCLNNPVNDFDVNGHLLFTFLIALIVGAVVGFASSVVTQGLTNGWNKIDWGLVLLDTIFGALSGLIAASPIGLFGQMLLGGTLSMFQYIGGQLITGEEITETGIFISFGLGALFSASDGMTFGKMPGKNIPKTTFVNQIEKESIKHLSKSFSNALSHYTKHVFSKLLKDFTIGTFRTNLITTGINILRYWINIGFNKINN